MAPCQMAVAPGVAARRRRFDLAGVEAPEPGLAGQAGQAAARSQLLERAGRPLPPGLPVDDGVAHLGQRTPPPEQPTAVDHAGPDAGRDGEIGDVGGPGARHRTRPRPRPPGRRRWRCGPACRAGPSAPRATAGRATALGQVRRPQEPPGLVVDGAGQADHRVGRGAVRAFGADRADEVDQRGRHVGVARRRRPIAAAARCRGRSTRAARICVPPTSAARTGASSRRRPHGAVSLGRHGSRSTERRRGSPGRDGVRLRGALQVLEQLGSR